MTLSTLTHCLSCPLALSLPSFPPPNTDRTSSLQQPFCTLHLARHSSLSASSQISIPLNHASLHNTRQHKLRAQARIDASSALVNHLRYITLPTPSCPRPRPPGDLAPIRLPPLNQSQSCRRTGLRRSLAYAWAVRIPSPPPRSSFPPLEPSAHPPYSSPIL